MSHLYKGIIAGPVLHTFRPFDPRYLLHSKYDGILAKIQHDPPFILGALPIIFLHKTRDWHVRQRRQPKRVSPRPRCIIQRLRVLRDPLVPHDNCARLIPYTTAKVLPAVHKVEQKSQEVIGLIVIPSHDALRVARVDEQRFFARDWMYGYNGMDGLGDPPLQCCVGAVVADFALHGLCGRVDCAETLEAFAEGRREPLKGAGHLRISSYVSTCGLV